MENNKNSPAFLLLATLIATPIIGFIKLVVDQWEAILSFLYFLSIGSFKLLILVSGGWLLYHLICLGVRGYQAYLYIRSIDGQIDAAQVKLTNTLLHFEHQLGVLNRSMFNLRHKRDRISDLPAEEFREFEQFLEQRKVIGKLMEASILLLRQNCCRVELLRKRLDLRRDMAQNDYPTCRTVARFEQPDTYQDELQTCLRLVGDNRLWELARLGRHNIHLSSLRDAAFHLRREEIEIGSFLSKSTQEQLSLLLEEVELGLEKLTEMDWMELDVWS